MSRSARAAAYIAAGLAFASAATTAYWLFGGTALLDTLGGSAERLARDRSSAALAVAVAVVVVKSVAGLLALLLLSPARPRWRTGSGTEAREAATERAVLRMVALGVPAAPGGAPRVRRRLARAPFQRVRGVPRRGP